MDTEQTIKWLKHKRQRQDVAEDKGDIKAVRDICQQIHDFGLERVYNRI